MHELLACVNSWRRDKFQIQYTSIPLLITLTENVHWISSEWPFKRKLMNRIFYVVLNKAFCLTTDNVNEPYPAALLFVFRFSLLQQNSKALWLCFLMFSSDRSRSNSNIYSDCPSNPLQKKMQADPVALSEVTELMGIGKLRRYNFKNIEKKTSNKYHI